MIFVIALDSVYLNPYYDVDLRLGQCITQAYTGDLSSHGVCQGPYIKGVLLHETQGNNVHLCTIIKEGHTAFTIDPYLHYIFYPIPLEKGVGIQEWSLLLMFYALGIPSWGVFCLAVLT